MPSIKSPVFSMWCGLLPRTVRLIRRVPGLGRWVATLRPQGCELEGDRAIEWSWVVAHLPRTTSTLLDVGCVQSVLAATAARLGHTVTAVDLREIEYEMPGISFRKGDLNHLDFGSTRFDVIVNCSTLEHMGLGGRYGATQHDDWDLVAMLRLRDLLADDGRMILTIPVGRDAVFAPEHRIYGSARLSLLLRHFRTIEDEYWRKDTTQKWRPIPKEQALDTVGSRSSYALGLMLLAPATASVP